MHMGNNRNSFPVLRLHIGKVTKEGSPVIPQLKHVHYNHNNMLQFVLL